MISNIAHQWKQPLNIVELCTTDLTIKSMMGEVDQQYQKKLFNEIHNQVAFMSKQLMYLKFLSEEHNNKQTEIFTIQRAVSESMQLLESLMSNKEIAIDVNLDKESLAYGSISEMEQAFLIILNNSIDAITSNNKDSGKISIECMIEDENSIIKIHDNGGGFNENILDKIFDAYFTTKHQSQGTGLGLFITKTIIEIKFNGTIEASNYKDGALFVIKIPLAREVDKTV